MYLSKQFLTLGNAPHPTKSQKPAIETGSVRRRRNLGPVVFFY